MKNRTLSLVFEGSLEDFFPGREAASLMTYFQEGAILKHVIESVGVPHTEIGGIRVNGTPESWDAPAQAGSLVHVLPVTTCQDSLPLPIREKILNGPTRFILDMHLGKLARYLRICGLDTRYENPAPDAVLAEVSARENRILLTRDRGLLMRKNVLRGYWLRSKDPREQLSEVVRRYDLRPSLRPFKRCPRCNGQLQRVPKNEILERLEEKTRLYYEDFQICPDCDQIYWKGSHFERLADLLNDIRGQATPNTRTRTFRRCPRVRCSNR